MLNPDTRLDQKSNRLPNHNHDQKYEFPGRTLEKNGGATYNIRRKRRPIELLATAKNRSIFLAVASCCIGPVPVPPMSVCVSLVCVYVLCLCVVCTIILESGHM